MSQRERELERALSNMLYLIHFQEPSLMRSPWPACANVLNLPSVIRARRLAGAEYADANFFNSGTHPQEMLVDRKSASIIEPECGANV